MRESRWRSVQLLIQWTTWNCLPTQACVVSSIHSSKQQCCSFGCSSTITESGLVTCQNPMGRLSAKENSYCSLEEVAGSVEAATPQEKGTVGGSFLVGVFAMESLSWRMKKGDLGVAFSLWCHVHGGYQIVWKVLQLHWTQHCLWANDGSKLATKKIQRRFRFISRAAQSLSWLTMFTTQNIV